MVTVVNLLPKYCDCTPDKPYYIRPEETLEKYSYPNNHFTTR